MQNQRLSPLLARAAAVQNMAAALPAAPAPQQPGLDVSESKAGLGIDFGSDVLLRSVGAAPGVTAGACVAGERARWCSTGVLTNFSQPKAAGFQLANASVLCGALL